MAKWSFVFGIVSAVGILFGVFSYQRGDIFGFRFWSWHQKLTVTVQSPNGPISSSAVAAASWEMPPRWFKIGDSGGWHGAGKVRGEAISLEVSSGKYLFVLLDNYSANTAIWTFAEPTLNPEHPDSYKRTLDRLEDTREIRRLAPKQYPLLVTFVDVSNPASVQLVDPSNLAGTFGPGYRLHSIALSITDEPVTDGNVESALPWLKRIGQTRPTLIPNPPLYRKDAKNPDLQYLMPGSFSTELYR
ncbi:hypothetical protein [Ensifer sp.]|uniref:hypothetical protein n=1 Tax=Ensifer sp. TaxID=1872086 RepID=UPI0028A14722|nr:hypothetical protein [Ensifer sp.]